MNTLFQEIISMVPLRPPSIPFSQKVTLWSFPWEKKILVAGIEIPLRDVLNSPEFREYFEEVIHQQAPSWTATIPPLERDTKVVSQNGTILIESDEAILIAAFSPCCEECGEKVVNGRLTCLC